MQTANEVLTSAGIIEEKVIANCWLHGACAEGLNWLREKPRTFVELRSHSLAWWRWLAQHCSHPDVLEKLASDPDADVRYYIAQNSNTPVTTLEKLASDPDADVRYYIARNSNTPVTTLEKLASDPNAAVRYKIARNANTPVTTLEKLASDPDAAVRREAKGVSA
jgi:hypothetical protein